MNLSKVISKFEGKYGQNLLEMSKNLYLINDFHSTIKREHSDDYQLAATKLNKGLTCHYSWSSSPKEHWDGMYSLWFSYKGSPIIGAFIRNTKIEDLFVFESLLDRYSDVKDENKIYHHRDHILESNTTFDPQQIQDILERCFPILFKKYDVRYRIYEAEQRVSAAEKNKQKEIRVERQKKQFDAFLNDQELIQQ